MIAYGCDRCGRVEQVDDDTLQVVQAPARWRLIRSVIEVMNFDGSIAVHESAKAHMCPDCCEELLIGMQIELEHIERVERMGADYENRR